jgi:hypothetical protein
MKPTNKLRDFLPALITTTFALATAHSATLLVTANNQGILTATYDGDPVTVTTDPVLILDGNNAASITKTYTIEVDYGDSVTSTFTFDLTATATGGVTAPQNTGRNGFGVGAAGDNGSAGAQLDIGETMTLSFGTISTGNVDFTVASQLFTAVALGAFAQDGDETASINGVSFTNTSGNSNNVVYTLPVPSSTVTVEKTAQTSALGGITFTEVTYQFEVIPEPSTALLGAIGLIALLRRKR